MNLTLATFSKKNEQLYNVWRCNEFGTEKSRLQKVHRNLHTRVCIETVRLQKLRQGLVSYPPLSQDESE